MPDDYKTAARKSRDRFERLVKQLLEDQLNAKISPIEEENIILLKELDMKSSIDYIVVNETGSRGLSSRVQDDASLEKIYRTFTIRFIRPSGARTELEKIKTAKDNNYVYPYWAVQAYTDGDRQLKRYALAKWDDILELHSRGESFVMRTGSNQIGQASFYVLPWRKFTDNNLYIHIHEEKSMALPIQSIIHWPEWGDPYHPLWPRETLEYWISHDMGTKDQQVRYHKDLIWYREHS